MSTDRCPHVHPAIPEYGRCVYTVRDAHCTTPDCPFTDEELQECSHFYLVDGKYRLGEGGMRLGHCGQSWRNDGSCGWVGDSSGHGVIGEWA